MAGAPRHLSDPMTKPTAESREERLIARYFKPLATHPGALGLVDDAAVIAPPVGCDLVLKTDGVIAGVHFFLEDPPDTVAKKVLRMNLSDLAAKGAKPLGFLLALALPQGVGEAWLAPFARGLGEDAELFGCPLLGGDTDHTPGPISVSVAAFGAVPHGKMVRRVRRQAGRPRRRDGHYRGCRPRPAVAARSGGCAALGPCSRAAGSPQGPLSGAAAAQRHRRGVARACVGRHGRLRRSCR